MHHEPPEHGALCRLVTAAIRARDAAPWSRLPPDQPFGVFDMESDRMFLAMANAHAGDASGVAAYPGADGYLTMQRILAGSLTHLCEDELLEVRAVVCAFVPWAALPTSGRRILGQAGFSHRRRELVPSFRSFLPGCMPFDLDADEARVMTMALEHSVMFAERFTKDVDLFEGGDLDLFRTLTRMEDGPDGLVYSWEGPTLDDVSGRRTWIPDQVTATRLERLPCQDDLEWEVAAVTGAGIVQTSAHDRPELMLTLIVVDRDSGFVHHMDVIPAPRLRTELPSRFVAALLRIGFKPRRILVDDYRLRQQIAPTVRLMGCTLRRVDRLPAIEEVRESLRTFM